MARLEKGSTGNVSPLGKTSLSEATFAAGISTTKATRHRASGGSHANPHPRDKHVGVGRNKDELLSGEAGYSPGKRKS